MTLLRSQGLALACALSLGAVAGPRDAVGRPRAGKEQVTSEAAEAAAVAEDHFNAGRYLQAARAFEALETRGAQYLYYAGLAYEALEHDAKAILLWTKVVAAFEVREELRAEARSRLEKAHARTTRFILAVDPPAAAEGALVELEYQSAGARDKLVLSTDELTTGVYLEGGLWTVRVRSPSKHHGEAVADVALTPSEAERHLTLALPELTQKVTLAFSPPVAGLHVTLIDPAGTSHAYDVTQGRHAGQLKRGTWKYRAEAPGYAPLEGTLEVADVDITRALQLRARPRPANLRPLAISAGVTSALLGVGGAVGLALSEARIYGAERIEGRVTTSEITRALDGIQFSSFAGGAAAGWLVTAAISTSRRSKARRVAWMAQAIFSPLVTAGSTMWAVLWLPGWRSEHLTPYNDGDGEPRRLTPSEVSLYRANMYPSMIVAGLGASLFLGALTGLALERSRASGRRARAFEFTGVLPLTFKFR